MPRNYDLPTQEWKGFLWNDDFAVYYCDGAARFNGYPNATSGCGVYGGPRMKWSFENPSGQINPDFNTNNFGELHAIQHALGLASERGLNRVEIRTDSMYCINAITDWSYGWRARAEFHGNSDWFSNKGHPIVHQNVIVSIKILEQEFDQVRYFHVRGHGSDDGNRIANDLAQAACDY